MSSDPSTPAWSAALAYAVTGRRWPELTGAEVMLPGALARWLRERTEPSGERYAVPADLMLGIGPAQFLARLTQLESALGPTATAPVVTDRPLTADERRLLADVPPHHGT